MRYPLFVPLDTGEQKMAPYPKSDFRKPQQRIVVFKSLKFALSSAANSSRVQLREQVCWRVLHEHFSGLTLAGMILAALLFGMRFHVL